MFYKLFSLKKWEKKVTLILWLLSKTHIHRHFLCVRVNFPMYHYALRKRDRLAKINKWMDGQMRWYGLWRAGACESRWWHLCAWLDKCLACWAPKGDSDSVDLHSDVVVGFVSEPAGCLHVQHHRSEITADACGPSWTLGIWAAWKLQQDAYMAVCI